MKAYEKPTVAINEGNSEGVYAASGDSSCWTVDVYSSQDWNGTGHVFRVACVHSDSAGHASTSSTVTVTFNYDIVSATAEYPCTVSGNTVTITRELYGNAEYSGDSVNYMLVVSTGDEATTKGLAVTGATISCSQTASVNGYSD